MKLKHRHEWALTPKEAVALQKRLAPEVISDQPLDLNAVKLVAGVDVSVKHKVSKAAVVVLTFPELDIIETATASQPTPFPYVPGLLSFREGPVLVAAFEKLRRVPDVFIFDGMGIMHPRRLGIAAHMGLWLDKPTVGCGKSHLLGTYAPPQPEKGSSSVVMDKGEQLGVILRTRTNIKPVYISVGHRCDLASAIALTLRCTTQYRLPQPIREAHNAAGK